MLYIKLQQYKYTITNFGEISWFNIRSTRNLSKIKMVILKCHIDGKFFRRRAGWRKWTSKGCPHDEECSLTAKRRVSSWSSWGAVSMATAALPRRMKCGLSTPPERRPAWWCGVHPTGIAPGPVFLAKWVVGRVGGRWRTSEGEARLEGWSKLIKVAIKMK